jgi:hypothetical protein
MRHKAITGDFSLSFSNINFTHQGVARKSATGRLVEAGPERGAHILDSGLE